MSSWKDNSQVVTAGVSVAAAVVFMVTIYEQSFIPTRLAGVKNELVEKKKEAERVTTALVEMKRQKEESDAVFKRSAGESGKKISSLLSDLEAARLQLSDAKNVDVFQHNNPYPKGFGKLRVGDSANNIFDVYDKAKVDTREASYYSVQEIEGGLIANLTYYFDEEDVAKKITHVLVMLEPFGKVSEGFLQSTLEEKLGRPINLPKSGYFAWSIDGGGHVFKDDSMSYTIMASNLTPGTWPKKFSSLIFESRQ